MGFIDIPKRNTEEEKILQQKYAKLKRKKKALQNMNAPPKVEPPPVQVAMKRAAESGSKSEATEMAKKLIRTGQIAAFKAREIKDDKGFKRSGSHDKKQLGDKPGGYRPYNSQRSEDGESSAPETPVSPVPKGPQYKQYNLYDNFVSPKEVETMAREETNRDRRRDGKANYVNRDVPNQVNTIYIHAPGLTERFIRSVFTDYGNLLHVYVQDQKSCAHVTYETMEEANEAINKMNEATVEGIKLHVSLARTQPHLLANKQSHDLSHDQAVNSWRKRAGQSKSNSENKTDPKAATDNREKVVYDTSLFD